MKIAIIMQRASDKEDDIVLEDGEFLEGEQIDKVCSSVYKMCEKERLDIELVKKINKDYSLAVLYHPKKDDFGRIRLAIVVYQNSLDEKILKDSLDKFGLDYEYFLQLKNKNKSNKKIIIGMIILSILMIILSILGVITWIETAS